MINKSTQNDESLHVDKISGYRDGLPDIEGYTLTGELGRGGFGTVYRAVQKSTGQTVAIKFQNPIDIAGENQKRIERFKRETRIYAELVHPHIVKLLDKGISDDRYYAVFEYIPGTTLAELLVAKRILPAVDAGEYMAQTLDALACAHARGVVHRDLKPQNIMVTQTDARPFVKVLDFGIGTLIPEVRTAEYQSLTASAETIGTPSYSAPEQLRGDPPTVKSDLYAWGLVLLECLTGLPVIRGSTLAEIFHRQLDPRDIPLPQAIATHEVGQLLRRVLKKNPMERFGDTAQLYKDFVRINLNTLVGRLEPFAFIPEGTAQEPTASNVSFWAGVQSEQRQITVMCINLGVVPIGETKTGFEIIETIRSEQLNLCHDIGLRYGGFVAGNMGNRMMFYFGYPGKSDNDARLAARTALELIGDVHRRNLVLADQYGIRLELCIGMHTGMVIVRGKEVPSGTTADTALRIEALAKPGTIVVDRTTRELLRQHVEFEENEDQTVLVDGTLQQTYSIRGEKKAEALYSPEEGNLRLPLIGRETEMESILGGFHETKENKKRSMLVSGEAGIGKSRLTQELHKIVTQEACAVKDLRCMPEYINTALYPILEMLKTHMEVSPLDDPSTVTSRLDRLLRECDCDTVLALPILCSWMSLPQPGQAVILQHSPELQKRILFDALEKIVYSLCKDNVLILVAEDLHWMDPTSLELLDRLVKNDKERKLFLLMTARPEFANPWDAGSVKVLLLEKLPAPAVETMIGKITGNTRIEKRTLAKLTERTDCIPLYIEELTRMLLDNKQLTERDGVLVLEAENEEIPVTLKNLLGNRLIGLGADRETLQIAAVIGREFDHSLLVTVSSKDEIAIQEDLHNLISANLIYKQRRTRGANYIFRHALIRDAAYDSLLDSVKKETHRRIAETLEKEFSNFVKENPAEIARHFMAAGLFEKAVRYGTDSVMMTLKRSLNDDAIVHSTQVLQWIKKLPVDKQRKPELDINTLLTQALMGKYGWADNRVKERADRSLFLLNEVKGSVETVPALWALATYHHVAGNRQEVRDLSDELSRIAEQSGDPGLKVVAATLMGIRYQSDGEYGKAESSLEYALRSYDSERDRSHAMTYGFDTKAWSESTLGIVYWFMGYDKRVDEACTNAIAWARKMDHMPSLCIALLYYALVAYHRNDKAMTIGITTELLGLAEKYGFPAYTAYGSIIHCWAKGQSDTIRQILGGLQYLGCKLGVSLYTAMLADSLAEKGDTGEAISVIDTCIDSCTRDDEHAHECVFYLQKAKYEYRLFPRGSESIEKGLRKSAELGKKQEAFRIEVAALSELSRLFGTDSVKARIAVLLDKYPELRC